MKYYIIAGEASGDLHASNLVAEIKKKDKKAEFRGCGGDLMKAQGVDLLKHYRTMAYMGFVEVAVNLRKVLGNIALCKNDILEYQPDVVILVDYPGFNFRIADFAHEKGFKVIYYISPQLWAWKRRRVRKIKRSVDKMLVILPFEEEFYKRYGVDVTYVGNPLLDEQAKFGTSNRSIFLRRNSLGEKREIIAMLPGSRKQEVKRMLPVMLKVVPRFPEYQFVIAGVSSLDKALYKKIIGNSDVFLIENQTYELLQNSSAAMVTSGTATLETALFSVPEVVCYKATGISYLLAKWMIKVKFISLVNLVMGKEVVKELIQGDLTEHNIVKELELLLRNGKRQRQLLEDYEELKGRLGSAGASEKAAEVIINAMKPQK
ncbi:MAG: lipid-A-disaccharide synthase [Bacteroidales bacterium]|nr:lipid-A-disaccharide synthase [Bacteroidales bacterium]